MEKIKDFFKNWRDRAKEKKVNRMREELAQFAKERFNIINYEGTPVITYNGVIITVPDQKLSGDELIRQLMELRRIYVEK